MNDSQSPASASSLKVLLVDDDRSSSHNLAIQLRFVGEEVVLAGSSNWQQALDSSEAEGKAGEGILAVVVGCIYQSEPLALLQALHQHCPQLPLVWLGAADAAQVAGLPSSLQDCLQRLDSATLGYQSLLDVLRQARRMRGVAAAQPASSLISETGTAMFRSLSGESRGIQQVRQLLQQVAKREVTALISGESGTGKEIVARNIHYYSGRWGRPFIAVNCATLTPEQHGAELFGLAQGHRGALEARSGLLDQAEGGTLFLDEIADLPLNIQPLLLRFLEDRRYQRIGGETMQTADVRIVVATRHNLEKKIASGEFREDLYYRISVVPIVLPPLRQRPEDVPELVRELIASLERRGQASVRFNAQALLSLQQHHWPGNVRELANLVERLGIMQPNAVIGLSDLPVEYRYDVEELELRRSIAQAEEDAAAAEGALRHAPFGALAAESYAVSAMLPLDATRLEQYLESFERQLLEVALEDGGGVLGFAAERLKMTPARLQDRLQQLGIPVPATPAS